MGRRRVYKSAAERQKAHRERQVVTESVPVAPMVRTPRRPPSRPTRLATLVDGAQDLLDEYQDWLDRMPEAFEGTALHERLTDVVERLGIALEALDKYNINYSTMFPDLDGLCQHLQKRFVPKSCRSLFLKPISNVNGS